ncbi:MAG: NAD(P)-dependent oxidoreductase [Firmicutes bacterium]|nr:NAD(P)-dependent oxidoreductase [Bacillota bacterium]
MKILITGGNGFIARSLFEDFQNKYEVVSLNRQGLDLLDSGKVFDCIKRNNFDAVIHTATYDAAPAFSTKDPAKVLENNLRMFFNVARCRDYFGKMIYFGSGAEFNRENWVPGMREDYFDQYVPVDQYGFSKYVMTKYTVLNDGIYNLRLFGVFGKYDDWRYRFIPNNCLRAALDLPLTINRNVRFDYLYIDDLVKIVDWFLQNKPRQNIYNVCTGTVYDFKTLAAKVIQISGKNLEIIIKMDGIGREYSGDNSLLLAEIPGLEFTPMDRAIEVLYQWYVEHKQILIADNAMMFLESQ